MSDQLQKFMFSAAPVRGEIVSYGGVEFEVLEADPRRAKRLRIRPLHAPQPVAAD